ncbi:hypothetical protein X943_000158 [Babesia divergens]|uniref:Uncharacterized protein n=1 Tax=Babesia divergens TaxID=32595 RepID=A0AAD9GGZ4_BABDI|nr:hypothetical protein X943_000158 [Babesia divergens]
MWLFNSSPIKEVSPSVETLSVFLCGMASLQPLQLNFVGSGYAIRRFGYGPEAIGPFVGIVHAFQEFWCLVGMVCTTGVAQISGIPSVKRYKTYIMGTYSMVISALLALCNIRLLLLVGTSIGDSNITSYYWNLCLAGFLFGAYDGGVRSTSPENSVFYTLGQCLGGCCLTIFIVIMTKILTAMHAEMGYWMLYWQINFALAISFVSGILWNVVVIFNKFGPDRPKKGGNSNPDFLSVCGEGWPFMAMFSISLGSIFTVYPAVAPFQLLPLEKTQVILRVCLITDSVSASICTVLTKCCGMDKHWKNNHWYYYFIALLYIPFFTLMFTFIYVMHHPTGRLGKLIYMRPTVVFILTLIYFFSGRFTLQCGIGSLYANIKDTRGSGSSGGGNNVDTFLVLTGVVGMCVLLSTKFLFEGYMNAFRSAKAGLESGLPWPTEGLSGSKAFRYWLGCGVKGGLSMMGGVWTKDIRTQILH